jgi:hypothetical protein
MVSTKVWLLVSATEAEAVNTDVPAIVGTPDMIPETESPKPDGRLPAVSAHLAEEPPSS